MAKPRPGWASAFFGALTLLFVAIVSVGAYRGELLLPSKGFGVRVQRATNPLAFHLTAIFYVGLAGLASYPLWLLVRTGRNSAVPPGAGGAKAGRGNAINLTGCITVDAEGRSGEIRVALDRGSHAFWWEFGGGDCLAVIAVPGAQEWTQVPALAGYPRDAFLEALAREVGRLQCPSARYEIEPRAILFRTA